MFQQSNKKKKKTGLWPKFGMRRRCQWESVWKRRDRDREFIEIWLNIWINNHSDKTLNVNDFAELENQPNNLLMQKHSARLISVPRLTPPPLTRRYSPSPSLN